ncbi:hypothetical protein NQT66_13105 [Cellulophaga baltica]|uniref:hypothetical protein n=1 Tax=Cellulophaga baltica TaxID=76594 RepID=UPI0021483169|nr:hypothetical protein [Cellulophaga baltica]MCR1025754.1 hypothetical protein [Cellulophaga baltica]
MVGYVMLHRDILEWEWYESPNVMRVFLHLILKANFTDKKWQGRLVKRGQLITSINHLASDLAISSQQVRTSLEKLDVSGSIKIKATNRYTLVTIVKYGDWQSSSAIANKPNNNPITNKKQTDHKQITTTKEGKKDNKEKMKERRVSFKNNVFKYTQYSNEILNNFFDYWSEANDLNSKMKFEKNSIFNIETRLKSWKNKEKQWNTKKTQESGTISINR